MSVCGISRTIQRSVASSTIIPCFISRRMSSLLSPPSSVLGMKDLDRGAFGKDIEVPYIQTFAYSHLIASVLITLKSYALQIRSLASLNAPQESATEKIILLDPTKVTDWNSLEEKDRRLLESKGVTEANLKKKTIHLSYNNWDAAAVLRAVIGDSGPNVAGFSKVGHIVHLNLREEHEPYKKLVGKDSGIIGTVAAIHVVGGAFEVYGGISSEEDPWGLVILDKIPGIRTVINKTNSIENEYRNINYEILVGTDDLITVTKENGCTFHLDYSKVYWNPRLGTEHETIAKLLKRSTVFYDVFAGVGPFTIPAGKNCTVLANDLNPASFQWLQKNIVANKVSQRVTAFNMDAREFIQTVVKADMISRYTDDEASDLRFAMNLPASAETFLNSFRGLLRGCLNEDLEAVFHPPLVYLYCFEKGGGPSSEVYDRVRRHLDFSLEDASIKKHCVRKVAPNKDMLRLEFILPREVLLSKEDIAPISADVLSDNPPERDIKRRRMELT